MAKILMMLLLRLLLRRYINIRVIVLSAIRTSRISGKLIRCVSYFQLCYQCLDILIKHCLSCLMYYFRYPNTTFPCYIGVELRQKKNDSRITFLCRLRMSQSVWLFMHALELKLLVGMRNSTCSSTKVKCDHRSKFSNLSNWKEEA